MHSNYRPYCCDGITGEGVTDEAGVGARGESGAACRAKAGVAAKGSWPAAKSAFACFAKAIIVLIQESAMEHETSTRCCPSIASHFAADNAVMTEVRREPSVKQANHPISSRSVHHEVLGVEFVAIEFLSVAVRTALRRMSPVDFCLQNVIDVHLSWHG